MVYLGLMVVQFGSAHLFVFVFISSQLEGTRQLDHDAGTTPHAAVEQQSPR
jgi:hypothetical protein